MNVMPGILMSKMRGGRTKGEHLGVGEMPARFAGYERTLVTQASTR